MTEIEAQQFIARHTPRLHRCEVTEVKICRIESQISNTKWGAVALIFTSLIGMYHESKMGLWLRIGGVVIGLAGMVFALRRSRQLREVREILNLPARKNGLFSKKSPSALE
ncbi:MAG TPA: hypothetical protein VGI03_13015 [Verrucomicrobiae bacterium]|jgi:hypothetical protein